MGDVGDYWREAKEYRKEQKAKFEKKIPMAFCKLDESGLPYREISDGHYRVSELFDWWPTTGTWMKLDGTKRGHQVTTLIEAVKAAKR